MNERITENLTREILKEKGFYSEKFTVEEQKSKNGRIDKLLKNASKSGDGVGKPEFIITTEHDSELLIVIECKADIKSHKSNDLTNARDYAVDGAVHYASYLSQGYNVLAIPLAAGVLSGIGIVISPAVGAVLMSLSTIIVAINAKLLKLKR